MAGTSISHPFISHLVAICFERLSDIRSVHFHVRGHNCQGMSITFKYRYLLSISRLNCNLEVLVFIGRKSSPVKNLKNKEKKRQTKCTWDIGSGIKIRSCWWKVIALITGKQMSLVNRSASPKIMFLWLLVEKGTPEVWWQNYYVVTAN